MQRQLLIFYKFITIFIPILVIFQIIQYFSSPEYPNSFARILTDSRIPPAASYYAYVKPRHNDTVTTYRN